DGHVTGVQTCALPIYLPRAAQAPGDDGPLEREIYRAREAGGGRTLRVARRHLNGERAVEQENRRRIDRELEIRRGRRRRRRRRWWWWRRRRYDEDVERVTCGVAQVAGRRRERITGADLIDRQITELGDACGGS